MIEVKNKNKCTGCSACVNICPKSCITMQVDNDGFLYPVVDKIKCTDCKKCDKICPTQNLKELVAQDKGAYAVVNNNEKTRLESSSGGVFSLIAEEVINNGGIVFGATFNEKFEVVHDYTDNLEDIAKFRGSKYTQSNINNTYSIAEKFLKSGKLVLFTGTPCQIEGLYAFLGRKYENLITQDLICHGVPSPKLWQKYVDNRSALAGARARRISSRRKDYGWKRYSVSFSFENDTEYLCQHSRDPFMQMFLKDLCLRPSCYECEFKMRDRKADITLADFWGIQNVLPEFDDDKGTSLVITHSHTGKEIFNRISDRITFAEVDFEMAISYNPAMIKSVALPKSRKSFMKDLDSKTIDKLQRKYCKVSLIKKLKMKIRSVLKRIIKVGK